MLNKLEFNNLVISNKKVIQQARAQSIAKIVQKLRKLKNDAEKKPDSEAHKERLRKNVECMSQLKLLKHVDIMRQLLLKDNSKFQATITNGRATPEEIGIAMLGLNKLMQELVTKFKKALKLSADANASWREEIIQTSKRRQKIERTEEKKRKRKELKELKIQEQKRLEWLEQNKPEVDEAEAAIVPAKIDDPVAKVEINSENPKIKEKVVKAKKVESKKLKAKSHAESSKQSSELEGLQESKQKVSKASEKSEPRVKKTKKPTIEKPEKPTHVVDPFFITESGQPYLSTAVVMSGESDESEDEYQPAQKIRRPAEKREDSKFTSFNNRGKEQAASGFKGSKIKFDDDGGQVQVSSTPVTETSTEGMHPSWIAKQKMKPKITLFSGTKIKFDDD